MAVYRDGDKWRVIYRYTNYKGERMNSMPEMVNSFQLPSSR